MMMTTFSVSVAVLNEAIIWVNGLKMSQVPTESEFSLPSHLDLCMSHLNLTPLVLSCPLLRTLYLPQATRSNSLVKPGNKLL